MIQLKYSMPEQQLKGTVILKKSIILILISLQPSSKIRLVISLTSMHISHIHQFDVNNAFLHGELQKDIYMFIPPDIKTNKPNQICKLKKSLYELKQASQNWYEKLTSTLIHNDYVQAKADNSFFIKQDKYSFTLLLVYVDDIIIARNPMEEYDQIKSVFHNQIQMKNLGQLKQFLGLEVAHSKKGISLCQRKYCIDLLSYLGFIESKLSAHLHILLSNYPMILALYTQIFQAIEY